MMVVKDEAEKNNVGRLYNKELNGRTALENYKLVVSYMNDQRVSFARAVTELDLDKIRSNLYRIRRDVINGNFDAIVSNAEKDELKRMTEWAVNFNPLIKTQTTKKRGRPKKAPEAKRIAAVEIAEPKKKEKKEERSRKVVCIVGDARDIAASLAEILKGGN